MYKRKMVYVCISIGVATITFFGWELTARSAYESAEYTVIESEGSFETREYPDLMMAVTDTSFKSKRDDGSFMRLFRYISGANQKKQKVAMTTPVFMEPGTSDQMGQMGFVIPKTIVQQRIPEPSNNNVLIRKRVGGRFAVIRFAGHMNRESVANAEEDLRKWMAEKGFNGNGEIETAGYDPPWTPGPLRRNEVLIRLK